MEKTAFYALLFVITAFYSCFGQAEIYKWKDANGKIHFGDVKPESQPVETIELTVNSYESVSFESVFPDLMEQGNTKKQNDKVIMYSTVWCGYCKKARSYFAAKGIRYTDYDIEKDESAKRRYDKLKGRGVPVILVGDQRMNGFSEEGFQRIYKR